MTCIPKRAIHSLGGLRWPLVRPKPYLISPEKQIEEEWLTGYDPQNHRLVHLGKIMRKRYQMLVGLGSGTQSTVWFAQNLLWATLILEMEVRAS